MIAAAASLLILLAPALWNGYPLLQWDTGGYLARWFEGYLVPSRAGAYGLLLAAGIRLDFWPIVLLQAAATLWIVALIFRMHRLANRPFAFLLAIATLSIATALPFLADLLLTDIFAGLSVLALYLLFAGGDRLGRATRYALIVFTAASAATHSATFGVLAVLALAATIAGWLDPQRFSRSGRPARDHCGDARRRSYLCRKLRGIEAMVMDAGRLWHRVRPHARRRDRQSLSLTTIVPIRI